MATVNEKMTAIASAIREKGSIDHPLTLDEMAQSISRVYDNGHEHGFMEGFSSGEEEGLKRGEEWGAKVEYDRFWDACQRNGSRTSYVYGFSGTSWTDETYNPKYDIYASGTNGANNLFLYSAITDAKVAITLDGTNTQNAFAGASLKRIPLIRLVGNVKFTTSFAVTNHQLEYIRFEGEIRNPINFSYCANLSQDSILNIIEHLATINTAQTLTLGTVNLGKLTDAEKAIATQKGWTLA